MLFNSFEFVFGFLPLALFLTYLARPYSWPAKLILTLLSLAFYAWWRPPGVGPPQLLILVGSIVFNFIVGRQIQDAYAKDRSGVVRAWLTLGVLCDLSLLGWFKYADFIAHNVSLALHADYELPRIMLPLAISFFTFQKLAYLIDSSRGEAKKMSFLDFSLFAAFFPQLISGPIVHYREVVPQLMRRGLLAKLPTNLLVGLVIFAIGLFKKTVIADSLALYANPLFRMAETHAGLNPLIGWTMAVVFTCQLYFDFSGYSDMAIGLGRMLGVKLPLNFHSPLRASNIIDYWRRWHMTLQRFIMAYIFQPLSLPLNRMAAERGLTGWWAFAISVALPSSVTFVAIGVWHGAGWTFVMFGVMHAIYVCTNQYWRERRGRRHRAMRRLGRRIAEPGRIETIFYHLLTLVAVMFANVMFRATSVANAFSIWRGMIGIDRESAPAADQILVGLGLPLLLSASAFIIFLMPNTQQIMGRFDPAWNWREWRGVARPRLAWTWKPSFVGLVFAGVTLFFGIVFIERGPAVFIYFNF